MTFDEQIMKFVSRHERKAFYEKELFREAARLLSRMDRCPVSLSRGCLDREYWAWVTKDYANMDMQRGVAILAYLHSTEFPDNGYFHQKALIDWISYGVSFWIERQNPDGGI